MLLEEADIFEGLTQQQQQQQQQREKRERERLARLAEEEARRQRQAQAEEERRAAEEQVRMEELRKQKCAEAVRKRQEQEAREQEQLRQEQLERQQAEERARLKAERARRAEEAALERQLQQARQAARPPPERRLEERVHPLDVASVVERALRAMDRVAQQAAGEARAAADQLAQLDPAEELLAPLLLRRMGRGHALGPDGLPAEEWVLTSAALFVAGLPHDFTSQHLRSLILAGGQQGVQGKCCLPCMGQQRRLQAVGVRAR